MMMLGEITGKLGLKNLTPELTSANKTEVKAGHSSDLLSDVLANAPGGSMLVTIQVHVNVIAVAVHAGLSGVIFASGMVPEERVRQKAVEEGLPLFVSAEPTFDIVGKLYGLGLRGQGS
jgi:hypothetical protein